MSTIKSFCYLLKDRRILRFNVGILLLIYIATDLYRYLFYTISEAAFIFHIYNQMKIKVSVIITPAGIHFVNVVSTKGK